MGTALAWASAGVRHHGAFERTRARDRGGKARALAPTAPPAASASARAPAEVEDAAPAPPPLANLFKLCGVDGMKNITREGNVATVHDKFLGRKVLVVQGNVPAANFARLPKVGRPALGLTGGFLYAQVKLDPERVFAVHVDLISPRLVRRVALERQRGVPDRSQDGSTVPHQPVPSQDRPGTPRRRGVRHPRARADRSRVGHRAVRPSRVAQEGSEEGRRGQNVDVRVRPKRSTRRRDIGV